MPHLHFRQCVYVYVNGCVLHHLLLRFYFLFLPILYFLLNFVQGFYHHSFLLLHQALAQISIDHDCFFSFLHHALYLQEIHLVVRDFRSRLEDSCLREVTLI